MSSSQHVYAADQGVDPSLWRRVHVITPLLEIWQILVAGFAFATYRNFSEIQEMLRSEYPLPFLSERFFYLVGERTDCHCRPGWFCFSPVVVPGLCSHGNCSVVTPWDS